MHVDDRWHRRGVDGRRVPTARHGRGKRWLARWHDNAGQERSQAFDRRVDAERKLASIRVSLGDGSYVDPQRSRMTIREWATRWLETRAHLKPKTRASYESLLRTRVLPAWSDVKLSRIDHSDVEAWVAGMVAEGLSASRVRQAYHVMTALLDAAVRDRRLAANPAQGVRLPRLPRTPMRFLGHEEVQALAEASGETSAPLMLVLAYTGVRWGEAAALRIGDVDLLRHRLDIGESLADVDGRLIFGPPKTHQRRTVAIPGFVCDAIAPLLAGKAPHELVFVSPQGAPLRLANWRRRVFDPAARRAGLAPLSPHDLRHTAASLMIAEGATVKAVQQQLGHASATTTLDRYAGLFPDELDNVARRLDEASARSGTEQRRNRHTVVPFTRRGMRG